jgi:hypothetical protein
MLPPFLLAIGRRPPRRSPPEASVGDTPDVDRLPHWKRGTAGVLCTAGPHPIPVSTAVRAGDHRLLLALGGRRETLSRLEQDDRVALCMLEEGLAFTAHGSASVLDRELESAQQVVVVELRVERVQDHLADGRTDVLEGARWRWREERWAEGDRILVDELERLAGE